MSLAFAFALLFFLLSAGCIAALAACLALSVHAPLFPLLVTSAASTAGLTASFAALFFISRKKIADAFALSRRLQEIISRKAENSVMQLTEKVTDLGNSLTEVKTLFNKEAVLLGEDPEARDQINLILAKTHASMDEAFELLQFEDYISQIREHIHQILQETLNFNPQSIEKYAKSIFSIDDEFLTLSNDSKNPEDFHDHFNHRRLGNHANANQKNTLTGWLRNFRSQKRRGRH